MSQICILAVWWLHSICPWFERKRTIFRWLITSWWEVHLKRLSIWSFEPTTQGKASCVSIFIFNGLSFKKEVRSILLCSIVKCSWSSKTSYNFKTYVTYGRSQYFHFEQEAKVCMRVELTINYFNEASAKNQNPSTPGHRFRTRSNDRWSLIDSQ